MSWDSTVAASAASFTSGCPNGHSGGSYGENMAWGYPDFPAAVKAWYDEISQYNFANPGWSSGTGHFTQVVWRDSIKLGCAMNKGCSMPTYVCQYSPAGE
jgi:uncharacterized protein YkwD